MARVLPLAMAWLAFAPLARAGGLLSGDAASTPSGKLKALCAAYWDEELRRDPLQATYFGEHRYDDRLPDPSVEARTALIARHRTTHDAAGALDPDLEAVGGRVHCAAGGGDPKLDLLGLAHQRDVARRRFVPAGRHTDEGLVNLLARQPHRIVEGPMWRTVGTFGGVTALQP